MQLLTAVCIVLYGLAQQILISLSKPGTGATMRYQPIWMTVTAALSWLAFLAIFAYALAGLWVK